MATIETKFDIGDTVYQAGTETVRKSHPCPDCLGSKKWAATSPGGGEYEFPCPRCAADFAARDEISLNYHTHTPTTRRLTIGSIQADTHKGQIRYMCCETGIGSGILWAEEDLFAEEGLAITAAANKANKLNRETPRLRKRFSSTLEISDYKLDNAVLRMAKSLRAKPMVRVNILLSAIDSAGTIEDVRQLMADFQE